jgi:DNA-binding NtrC family response regulator
MKPANPILIIDDQRTIQAIIAKLLSKAGYDHVVNCTDERDAIHIIENQEIDLILLDVVMPYISGEELLIDIRKTVPQIPVIMVTSQNDTATVVRCMRNGAYDYITKPIDRDLLAAAVERALQFRELERQNLRLRNNLLAASPSNRAIFKNIITDSSKMITLFKYCEAVAPGKEPVLITGETGTGKELMARAFHAASHCKGPFVAVNVAGVDDHVFSDTLFGHEKGAFTGADRPRHGFIGKAQGGTLFLDEIGDLSEGSQIKLLRVIQENEYFALGSDQPIPTDARIIVATHKNLAMLQESQQFRKDLFFRLRTHHMEIPPLRERLEDIGLLLDFFMEEAAKQFDKAKPTYPKELIQLLKVHTFPGNIRELRAMVFDAVARHTSKVLSTEVFSKYIFPANPKPQAGRSAEKKKLYKDFDTLPTLKAAAEALIDEAMHRAGSNQKIAAGMLGITPPALSKRLKQRTERSESCGSPPNVKVERLYQGR